MRVGRLALVLVSIVMVAACGPSKLGNGGATASPGTGDVDCSGAALDPAETGLPEDFPQLEEAVFTSTQEAGPSTVVQGHYAGRVAEAYGAYKAALDEAGYGLLFDELEAHDSEISWRAPDESSTGQVAMREQCTQAGTTHLQVTVRPA